MAPYARILLRYASGVLMAKAWLSPDTANFLTSDPDVAMVTELALAAGVGAVSEAWYALAKRWGWSK